MNEEYNAVWRLGSRTDEECWSERMRSMPEEAGQNESGAHQSEGDGEEIFPHYATVFATLGAAFVGTFIVSLIVSRMWDEDEIKLHILDALIKMFQAIARITGSWAIECENAYNEYVNALH